MGCGGRAGSDGRTRAAEIRSGPRVCVIARAHQLNGCLCMLAEDELHFKCAMANGGVGGGGAGRTICVCVDQSIANRSPPPNPTFFDRRVRPRPHHMRCLFTSIARQCRKPTTHAHTNISRERARARIRSMWPCAADVTTPPHSHACARACVRSRACTRSFPPLPPGGQGKTDFLSMCT